MWDRAKLCGCYNYVKKSFSFIFYLSLPSLISLSSLLFCFFFSSHHPFFSFLPSSFFFLLSPPIIQLCFLSSPSFIFPFPFLALSLSSAYIPSSPISLHYFFPLLPLVFFFFFTFLFSFSCCCCFLLSPFTHFFFLYTSICQSVNAPLTLLCLSMYLYVNLLY